MSLFITKTDTKLKELFDKHKVILDNAIKAVHNRTFYAQYPELPKVYGEIAPVEGEKRFKEQLNKPFSRLSQSSDSQLVSDEISPYTLQKLNISYPTNKDINSTILLSQKASQTWKHTDPQSRAAILIESLERIKNDFFEIAHSTMHTTGQAFMMSFQASGPHSNDRALETIALGYQEQTRFPSNVVWDKPMGKTNAILTKHYRCVPRGIALTIGCSTFPLWNSLPGIYASLITGNTVIVKAHPTAIYPLAIAVARIQEVLKEYNLDPNTIVLAPDNDTRLIAKEFAQHPAVKIIDFTGSTPFGEYIESLKNKVTFTEKAGVNSIIFDSATEMNPVLQNIAFSLSLYSGQMCTAPQNIFVPKDGVTINGEKISYAQVTAALADAIQSLANNPKAAPHILGAIQSEQTLNRIKNTTQLKAKIILPSQPLSNPDFPNARTATPTLLEVQPSDMQIYQQEQFGPITFIIPTDNTNHSIQLAKNIAEMHGALSCSAYSTDPKIIQYIAEEMADVATPVSFNLTGQIYVNQNAGFSDFHGSGGNPAANASFTDSPFLTKRFTIVGMRIQ